VVVLVRVGACCWVGRMVSLVCSLGKGGSDNSIFDPAGAVEVEWTSDELRTVVVEEGERTAVAVGVGVVKFQGRIRFSDDILREPNERIRSAREDGFGGVVGVGVFMFVTVFVWRLGGVVLTVVFRVTVAPVVLT